MHLATPKALGGTGKGYNPEQLFAAGYAGKVFFIGYSVMRVRVFCVKRTGSVLPGRSSTHGWKNWQTGPRG
jgi:hypothetical protein